MPQPGHKDEARQAHEAQPWLRAALRFRAGLEGRISHLRRARQLDRCRDRGQIGLERWLGWGVVANKHVIRDEVGFPDRNYRVDELDRLLGGLDQTDAVE